MPYLKWFRDDPDGNGQRAAKDLRAEQFQEGNLLIAVLNTRSPEHAAQIHKLLMGRYQVNAITVYPQEDYHQEEPQEDIQDLGNQDLCAPDMRTGEKWLTEQRLVEHEMVNEPTESGV